LLLAATVRSFVDMLLELSDHNTIKGKSSVDTNLQFEVYPPLPTHNVEF